MEIIKLPKYILLKLLSIKIFKIILKNKCSNLCNIIYTLFFTPWHLIDSSINRNNYAWILLWKFMKY